MRLRRTMVFVLAVGVALALQGRAPAWAEPTQEPSAAEPSRGDEILVPSPLLTPEPPREPHLLGASLQGPRWEISGGVLLIAGGVVSGMIVALAAGPGLFPCGLLGPEDPVCEADARRDQRRANGAGIAVGLMAAAVGTGLIVHGVRRIHRIRAARRLVDLTLAPSHSGRSGIGLSTSITF